MTERGTPERDGCELVVVRHGTTAWNRDGRFQGQADVPLDATGRAQAAAAAAGLAAERFELAIASDLARARETAAAILAGRDLALELDPRWREMRFGAWEGRTWAELVALDPSLDAPGRGPRDLVPPGGETFGDVARRIAPAFAELRARAARERLRRILLVTHAGVLHALLRLVAGDDDAALGARFAPASASRFALAGDAIVPLELGRTFS